MKANKKKIIVVVSMVLLLIATGCLNYFLTVGAAGTDDAGVVGGDSPIVSVVEDQDFFAAYREDRELTRAQQLLYLDEIIASDVSSTDAIVTAEDSRLSVVGAMEREMVLEGLIKAGGFDDCIVTMGTANINVVVKASELSDIQVMKILDLVVSETGVAAANVVVMPYI